MSSNYFPGLGGYPPTYWARTEHGTMVKTLSATKQMGYIWHPATSAKDLILLGTGCHLHKGANGSYSLDLYRITAEHATPGGTTPTIAESAVADVDAESKVVSLPTNAPTMGAIFYTHLADAGDNQDVDLELPQYAKPLTVRGGVAGGFAWVFTVTDAITTEPDGDTFWCWLELPTAWPSGH